MTPLEETMRAQRAAANPASSAFVAANAGAGKTRVLTDRVARLLLAGAAPDKILCITFTKAAAAEMASRLFSLLGRWSLADDAALRGELAELDGEARDDAALAGARRLFARALDTPGGLKIQTIHSFCESVLRRFPIEAGVAPGFSVIEEAEAARLAGAAVDAIAARAGADPAIGPAMRRLVDRRDPGELKPLLVSKLGGRQGLEAALELAGGWPGLAERAARALGDPPDESALLAEAASVIGPDEMRSLQDALRHGGKTARELAEGPAARFLAAAGSGEKVEALRSLFLTLEGTLRKRLIDAPAKKAAPWAERFCAERQASFAALADALNGARILEDTRAFFTLLQHAQAAYDGMKAARAALDYDDLIAHARRLFKDPSSAAWVLWKLDRGLDHILLDEAQDTSPGQWSVVEGPLDEFYAGAGAAQRPRTFFAVGDQKQSIYSFQGADATLFRAKRAALGKKLAAVGDFVEEPLLLSFRSTAPVLAFVDALFAEKGALEGLGEEDGLLHKVRREGEAGRVELWPPPPKTEKTAATPWDAPLDATPAKNPVRDLSEAVAAMIRGWLDTGERLASAGRPIRAGDIMILVQARSALFHGAIRALGEAGVPVAGADRLQLLDDAAVEDLLSYAEAVLLDTDDLSLAETLKSPFFGLGDEDLFALTRGDGGPLWRRLVDRADESPLFRRARDEIRLARRVALKEGAYAFLTHVLDSGEPSGRKRLFARLGSASRETIDELLRQALDYERDNPRSLQGFLAFARSNAGEIKREMGEAAGAVRVMTVHGAKGLEAPIVFLIDAHRPPNTGKTGPALDLVPDAAERGVPGLFVLAGSKSEDCAATAAARARAIRLQYEEYRRTLYVAATRARDRLYVCGLAGKEKDPSARDAAEKTWRALSVDAFARLDDVQRAPHPRGWGDILRIERPQTAEVRERASASAAPAEPAPAFLHAPAAPEAAPLRIAPSRLADDAEAAEEPHAFSPLRAGDRFLRGRSLHRLLELLPGVDLSARGAAADRLLARLAPEAPPVERARWRDEALAVLAHPDFAPVFAPESRAEAPIAGAPKGAPAGLAISGAIDRLAIVDGRILVVDYKTNRPPPARVEDAPAPYIAQLAAYRALLQEIYPDHQVECALLWTFEARLMPVPAALLDHAFKSALG